MSKTGVEGAIVGIRPIDGCHHSVDQISTGGGSRSGSGLNDKGFMLTSPAKNASR